MSAPRAWPVDRPTLLFDGACGFCRRAVLRLEASAGERVACVPYQDFDFAGAPPGLTPEACAEGVHLLEPDGRVSRAAEACFRAQAKAPARGFVALLYRLPGLGALADWGYAKVAGNRLRISRVQRALSGPHPEPSTYGIGRRLFVALLGLAFFAAFWSFGVQAAGLIGADGILPLGRMVAWDSHPLPQALLEMPSLFWFAPSDLALDAVLWIGAIAALALTFGLWPRLALGLAWVCWLSLTALAFPPDGAQYIGNEFLGYQWDGLLVEAGLLAFFVVPGGIRPRFDPRVGAAGLLLLRVLLFRLVFGEALARIVSADPTWAQDGALAKHLWTQPLPTWIGLRLQDLDPWVLDALLGAADLIGLGLAFLLFGPRRLRLAAVLAILVAEGAGFLVQPRGAWPLVVLGLALLAVDDASFRRLVPARLRRAGDPVPHRPTSLGCALRGGLAAVLVALAVHVSVGFFGGGEPSALQRTLQRWQVVNGYGPAPSVALGRVALGIEGSDDGETWTALEPRSAPRDPFRAPPGPGLHLRRLDWKLDDVAHRLAPDSDLPTWFVLLLTRLLEGSPAVRGLFAPGAYETAAPRVLRLVAHELLPAPAEARAGGRWWLQRPAVPIGVPVMLEDGKLVPARF
jgi:predicted DCC family thiol-disulfide oxidoreductase YuxK